MESGRKDIPDTLEVSKWAEDFADGMISHAIYNTRNKEIAEDLVQETFLSAIKNLEQFRFESQPKTWLYSILNNKIKDYHRSAFKTKTSLPVSDSFFSNDGHWEDSETPMKWEIQEENLLDDATFINIFTLCKKKLPEKWFSVIHLKYQENRSPTEICQELEISSSNYWQIIHRAKLNLRKCLDTHWFSK